MKHFSWSSRRIVWTIGMALGGFLIGGKAGHLNGIALGLICVPALDTGSGPFLTRIERQSSS